MLTRGGCVLMLKEFDFDRDKSAYTHFSFSDLGDKLGRLKRIANSMEIPVLVIVDGWESSGKGYMISKLIKDLEPRSSRVSVFSSPSANERDHPFLWRYWLKIPGKGELVVFDRSFYYELMSELDPDEETYQKIMQDVKAMEKQLIDDGTIVIKFFLHQTKETQTERIESLQEEEHASLLVGERDFTQNKAYDQYLNYFDRILTDSNYDFCPWYVLSSENSKACAKTLMGQVAISLTKGINRAIAREQKAETFVRDYQEVSRPLAGIDLNLSIEKKLYKKKLKTLQKEAGRLSFELYRKNIPVVLAFEGVDAAGKGGAIKRLTQSFDPRGYRVMSVGAPDETQDRYHYLWRFYQAMPRRAAMTIFDRSWYGRVLVERVEGFAHPEEWNRAYQEINEMERHMGHSNTLIMKFFIYIDKDEQLKRFKARQNDPDKMHKLTDEDWRNREKWDQYIAAMNEMLVRTHTTHAPWVIVEGMDKRFARIKVLESFIEQAEKYLN